MSQAKPSSSWYWSLSEKRGYLSFSVYLNESNLKLELELFLNLKLDIGLFILFMAW